MDNHKMIENLKNAGVSVAPGMTNAELAKAENVFGFRFPKEIWEFLSCGVPEGGAFFDYRDTSGDNLARFREFQQSVVESFKFDWENNREELQSVLGAAEEETVIGYLHESVRLIPFYAHRCFFDGMDDMPIVSFWQPTDTVFYGGTFENYLEVEFLKKACVLENIQERMKNTGIWRTLIET